MNNSKMFTALGASLLFASLSGCSGDDKSGPPIMEHSEEQARLNQNLSRWQDANIDEYDYEYRRSCYCPDPLQTVVSVQDDKVTEAFYREDGTYISDKTLEQLYTVNEFFEIVQDAIHDDVFSLEVEYDASRGYPTRIAIDRDEQVADEEISHYVTGLQ